MKEAFWGILIVFLGLFGIVIMNLFQEVTVGNDEVYYVIKETAEAAMLDGIDMAHYRLTGEIKVIGEKVAENLIRRFAQNITNRKKYTIVIYDINQEPPKISVEVRVNMLGTDITNKVDAIIETKYDLDTLLEFLGITEEEWNSRVTIGKEEEKECLITTTNKEYECIPGDVEFVGWEHVTLPERACQTDVLNNVTREANYRVCKCGVWEKKREEINATVKSKEKEIEYTWVFKREAEEDEIRSINESITKTVIKDVCTTGINIMVPKDLTKPTTENDSDYVVCGSEGIRIPINTEVYMRGGYIPENASNRNLTWKLNNEGKAILQYSNPSTSTGFSKASIKASKIGTTTVTATSTSGQTGTCKVTIYDIESVGCKDKTMKVNTSGTMISTYTPEYATKTDFTWTSSDISIATIDSNTGNIEGKSAGKTTITVTSPNGKTGTCTLIIEKRQSSGGGTGCSCTFNKGAKVAYACTKCNGKISKDCLNKQYVAGYWNYIYDSRSDNYKAVWIPAHYICTSYGPEKCSGDWFEDVCNEYLDKNTTVGGARTIIIDAEGNIKSVCRTSLGDC